MINLLYLCNPFIEHKDVSDDNNYFEGGYEDMEVSEI